MFNIIGGGRGRYYIQKTRVSVQGEEEKRKQIANKAFLFIISVAAGRTLQQQASHPHRSPSAPRRRKIIPSQMKVENFS